MALKINGVRVAGIGAHGKDGAGVASGGTTGQVLAKRNESDYDTQWIDLPTYTASDVGADVSGSAEAALISAKTYTDEQIAAIPTPDVSGQIEAHNTNESAHADIREAVTANQSAVGAAQAQADAAYSLAETKVSSDDFTSHTNNTSNPHGVTAAQINAATTTDMVAHTSNTNNPHSVTAEQVGADPKGSAATVQTALDTHIADKNNPHSVTVDQIGAVPTSRTVNGKTLSANISLTASDVGADESGSANQALEDAKDYTDEKVAELLNNSTTAVDSIMELATAMENNADAIEALEGIAASKAAASDLTAHTGDKSNPHGVTATQVGADPAGSAAGVQTNLDTHTTNKNNPHGVTLAQLGGAAASDLTSHTGNTSNPHGVTASQVGLGNVPNVATNDQTPTYTAATSLTALTSGEKLSVAFGKIAKAISDLISHIGNKSNPHSVTASQVGADAAGTADSAVTSHNTNASAHNDIRTAASDAATAASTAQTRADTAYSLAEGKADSDHTHDITDLGLSEALLLKDVAATLPSSQMWRRVAYGNGKFVTVAQRSDIAAYSTDGITWTTTSMPSSATWTDLTYGNGKFVAIASSSDTAAYSTDGITWTTTSMPSSTTWSNLTYGNGKFVAAAYGTINVAYSTDGITWNATVLPSATKYNSGLAYGNSKFVLVDSGTSSAFYSTDGITWTTTSMPSSKYWCTPTYGNGKFVTGAETGGCAAYSTDGITWTYADMPNAYQWKSFTYGQGKFVAVTTQSTHAAYSIDGITWTLTTMPSSQSWHYVSYCADRFLTTVMDSDVVAVSYDGVTWQTDGIMLVTPDGASKTATTLNALGAQKVITGTAGQFVVIGSDGNVTTKTIPSAEEASF